MSNPSDTPQTQTIRTILEELSMYHHEVHPSDMSVQQALAAIQSLVEDEFTRLIEPEGIVMQGNTMMYKCNVEALVEEVLANVMGGKPKEVDDATSTRL